MLDDIRCRHDIEMPLERKIFGIVEDRGDWAKFGDCLKGCGGNIDGCDGSGPSFGGFYDEIASPGADVADIFVSNIDQRCEPPRKMFNATIA
jgi:hypothetical protein